MGIETRRNGRRYLYRKERTPSGVRSVYLGPASDPGCRLLVACAEDRRMEAEADRDRRRRDLAPLDLALGTLRQYADALRPYVRAYLVATGHRTHRGQWRRARYLRSTVAALPPLTLPPMARKSAPSPSSADGYRIGTAVGVPVTIPADGTPRPELVAAIKACQTDNPTPADVSRLRDALADLPASTFEPFADRIALRSASALLTGGTYGEPTAGNAVVEAEALRFEADLAGDGGPLVRAAAAQAALARVVLDAVTDRYGRAVSGSYNIDHAAAFERRMNAAQTRYLRALATVAALRRAEGIEAERDARIGRNAGDGDGGDRRSIYADLSPRPALPSGDSLPAPSDLALSGG